MPIASPSIYFGAVRLPSLLVENLEDKDESKMHDCEKLDKHYFMFALPF